ncbi:MAG: sel1 repeat family protein [Treponema sp.]|nr:sel1 repeat family protein [Candidatus Treponema equifaecale]
MSEEFEYDIYQLSHVHVDELIHLAYDKNDAEAQCALGYCYENGIEVDQDKEKAFHLYEMAAQQGEANGIYNMGVCLGFAIGTGKERDAQGWLTNIRRAAEMGFAPAQNDYGWAWECAKDRGFFDKKDEQEAFKWYLKSAKQDHQTGIRNVVRCYEEGIGVQKNPEEAEKWRIRLKDE